MPQRPNYRQERSERIRNKDARKAEKLEKKNEQAARRKALKDETAMPESLSGEPKPEDEH